MAGSSDWQLRIGPFRFRFAMRTLGLDDVPVAVAPSHRAPRLEPAPDPREVGHIRIVDDPPADAETGEEPS